jgi:hypothetical protein
MSSLTPEIQNEIDELGYRGVAKVYDYIHKRHPDVLKADIAKYLKDLPKDTLPKDMRDHMHKTYTNYVGGWQMDLFVNKQIYHLMCIEINNRYIYMSNKLLRKDTDTVLPAIKAFVKKFHPVSIFCDNESSFVDKRTVEYLISEEIKLKVITEQNHSALGILNRACRTLRDMLKTNDFTSEQLLRVVKIYNHSVHSSIGVHPALMLRNPDLEEAYISKTVIDEYHKKENQDDELQPGTRVRFVVEKRFGTKTRHKITPEFYVVTGREGNNYTIQSADGSSKSLPRYRLVTVEQGERIREAKGIEGGSVRGVVEEILDFYPKTNTYKVKFRGVEKPERVTMRNLREHDPTSITPIEREFVSKNRSRFKIEGNKIVVVK